MLGTIKPPIMKEMLSQLTTWELELKKETLETSF
jgi:hypothetical protein